MTSAYKTPNLTCRAKCYKIFIFFSRTIVINNRLDDDSLNDGKDYEFEQLAKTFALCTAYAANCGGIATLTGTPPNIILKGQADL